MTNSSISIFLILVLILGLENKMRLNKDGWIVYVLYISLAKLVFNLFHTLSNH